jgi:3-oxoacyl-[acyl-carrier protein] reductase
MSARHPELAGRVAVVTGGAKGIGRGIAERFAREGMRVVLADIDVDGMAEAVDALGEHGDGHLGVATDVGRPDDVDRLFDAVVDTYGTVDVLVNNAAHLERRRPLDQHDELLRLQLAVNIEGPYRCSQAAARLMATGQGGSIVNISSVGALRAHHRGLPYDITKGAINAMTMAMAVDLGEHGIRVNAIAPGVTHTWRTDRMVGTDRYRATASRIPLRRFGTVGDIAAAAAFLASDDASYITGQILAVDGGISTQLSPPGPGALEPEPQLPPDGPTPPERNDLI